MWHNLQARGFWSRKSEAPHTGLITFNRGGTMKWFQHDSDAIDSVKLKKLRKKFGMEGYGVYWAVLEYIARDIELDKPKERWGYLSDDYDIDFLADEMNLPSDKLQDMIRYMAEIHLIDPEYVGTGNVSKLKIVDRSDEYFKKILRRQSGKKTDNVRTKSGQDTPRLDLIRSDLNGSEWNGSEEISEGELSGDNSLSLQVRSDEPAKRCPYEKIVEVYHEVLPLHPHVSEITDPMKKTLKSRWREHPTLTWWADYFTLVSESQFLTGKKTDFIASFPWLIGPKNMTKVLNGQYGNHNNFVQAAIRDPDDILREFSDNFDKEVRDGKTRLATVHQVNDYGG